MAAVSSIRSITPACYRLALPVALADSMHGEMLAFDGAALEAIRA